MTSQIEIGRFGSDIETSEIDVWDMGGDRVQVSGDVWCDSVAEAFAARQQILGLADNPDEPLVPVSWVEDASLDGIYEVVASSVNTEQMTLLNGVLPWSVTLRRPRGSASMISEQILSGAGRDGYFGVLTPRYWTATQGSYAWASRTGSPTVATGSRNSYSPAGVTPFDVLEHSSLADATVTSFAVPAAFYAGAVRLRMGDPLYTQIGRQTANESHDWEIDNGLIKISSPADSSDLCDVKFYPSSGSAAPTVTYTLDLAHYSGGWTVLTPPTQGVTCTRNGIEEASLRFRGTNAITLDISVRRGDRGATFTMRGGSRNWGIGFDTTTACTVIDANNKGVYVTTADADANKPILVGSNTVTRDLTEGRIYRTSAATSWQAYIGTTYTGAAAPDTAVWQQEAWYAAMGEIVRPVSVG
jgi:hypothetical protein